MAGGKQMQAIISLVGKVDSSLKNAISSVEKQMGKLEKKSSKGASKLGSTLSGVGKSLATTVAVGATTAAAAAGAAFVKIGKDALDSYASYEQLVGGVDTLFKGASATVQQYAANAYKTAGVSANQYMEQATAFSASLIQSLGGDTQAAASYADLAIKDMSDNANKMGLNAFDGKAHVKPVELLGHPESLMSYNVA